VTRTCSSAVSAQKDSYDGQYEVCGLLGLGHPKVVDSARDP